MKQQPLEAASDLKPIVSKNVILCIILSALILNACENDIEKIKSITKGIVLPDVTMIDANIVYSDSARIKLRVLAPVMSNFDLPKDPYIEFPKGVKVTFYNASKQITSTITARYAIYYTQKELWEARHDVVAKNDKGEHLNTELMFWDQKEERIYSNLFSKITTADGVFCGRDGFEAEQDFSKWKLIGSEGTVNIKDEEVN